MGNNIDKVFNEILKDYEAIAMDAIKDAAHKGQKDIMDEAKKYLNKYYKNYKPKMYKRTYRLKRAIIPYWSDRSNGKKILISIGVQYNAAALKGAYRSNSPYHQYGDEWISVSKSNKRAFSADYGIPEPTWILDNYLAGIHPWAKTDSEGTYDLMSKFFDDELPRHIEEYISGSLVNAFLSRL